jgi:hypothetical protein
MRQSSALANAEHLKAHTNALQLLSQDGNFTVWTAEHLHDSVRFTTSPSRLYVINDGAALWRLTCSSSAFAASLRRYWWLSSSLHRLQKRRYWRHQQRQLRAFFRPLTVWCSQSPLPWWCVTRPESLRCRSVVMDRIRHVRRRDSSCVPPRECCTQISRHILTRWRCVVARLERCRLLAPDSRAAVPRERMLRLSPTPRARRAGRRRLLIPYRPQRRQQQRHLSLPLLQV